MKIRLRYQSLCDLTMLPTYCRAPEVHTRAMADEETEIVVHVPRLGTYGDGSISHISSHLLNGAPEVA